MEDIRVATLKTLRNKTCKSLRGCNYFNMVQELALIMTVQDKLNSEPTKFILFLKKII